MDSNHDSRKPFGMCNLQILKRPRLPKRTRKTPIGTASVQSGSESAGHDFEDEARQACWPLWHAAGRNAVVGIPESPFGFSFRMATTHSRCGSSSVHRRGWVHLRLKRAPDTWVDPGRRALTGQQAFLFPTCRTLPGVPACDAMWLAAIHPGTPRLPAGRPSVCASPDRSARCAGE